MRDGYDLQFAGYVPGAIGRTAEMHAAQYSVSHGFGLFFEARVAAEMAEFLKRFNEEQDFFRTVSEAGRVVATITIDGSETDDDVAHVRWFIVESHLRGRGIGNRLMDEAMAFCREKGFARAYLWTLTDLEAAGHLYLKAGFKVVEEFVGDQWGRAVTEQRMEVVF